MFNVHKSQRCIEDPRGSHETLLANPHATLDAVTHKVPTAGRAVSLSIGKTGQSAPCPKLLILSSFSLSTYRHAYRHLGSLHSHCYSVGRSLQDRS